MNPSETVTSLKLEQSVFNSEETEILAAAFEKAWAFVEFDPKLKALEESNRRSELARCLMKLLKRGEMPAIQVGKRFFIPRTALLKWLENAGSRPLNTSDLDALSGNRPSVPTKRTKRR